MNNFILWFVKITGWPIQSIYFRKKIYFINKEKQGRYIDGGALIVSNHISVYDFPLMMYVFYKNKIRTLIAKTTADKNILFTKFLKWIGGIIVDRTSYDFAFMSEMIESINRGDVGLIFPEARVERVEGESEKGMLPFKPSFVYIALEAGVPIVPVYTNGIYGKKKKKEKSRTKVIIGEKIYLNEMLDKSKSKKENIDYLCNYVQEYIKYLGEKIDEK